MTFTGSRRSLWTSTPRILRLIQKNLLSEEENLEDTQVSASAYTSHDSDSERTLTNDIQEIHFPLLEHWKSHSILRIKMTPCRRHCDEVERRAEKFDDSQWIQWYPWVGGILGGGGGGKLYESFSSRRKSRKSIILFFLRFWKILWKLIMESLCVNTPSIRYEWYYWKTDRSIKSMDVCSFITIRLELKVISWSHKIELLLTKCPRPLARWENN